MPGFRLVPGSCAHDIGLTPVDFAPRSEQDWWPVFPFGAHGEVYCRSKLPVWPDAAPQLSARAARKLAQAYTWAAAADAVPKSFINAARMFFGHVDLRPYKGDTMNLAEIAAAVRAVYPAEHVEEAVEGDRVKAPGILVFLRDDGWHAVTGCWSPGGIAATEVNPVTWPHHVLNAARHGRLFYEDFTDSKIA
jgi:hypothetical protein